MRWAFVKVLEAGAQRETQNRKVNAKLKMTRYRLSSRLPSWAGAEKPLEPEGSKQGLEGLGGLQ